MIHKTLTLTSVSALGAMALAGVAQAQVFMNATPITIPDAGTSPFPSSILVAGVAAAPGYDINVTLHGLSHTFLDDLDILVTGPGGYQVMIMSDAGGFGPGVVGATYTFSDGSPAMPDSVIPASGTYAPTNYGAVDPMDAPAPAGPYGSVLNLGASDPNGTWNLWIVDDAAADVGSLSGGWSITFSPIPTPGALALLGLAGLVGGRRRR